MNLTQEQQAFVESLLQKTPVFLSARAGTGKTSTILAGVKALLESGVPKEDITIIAFNKKNQQELQAKTPVGTYTLHSLGFRALKEVLPGVQISEDKTFKLLCQEPHRPGSNSRDTFRDTLRLVGVAKAAGLVPKAKGLLKSSLVEDTPQTWLNLQSTYELFDADLKMARRVLVKSNAQAMKDRLIDFGDMVYLPMALQKKIATTPWTIVDEAQDLSPLDLSLLTGTRAKIWYVGDPFQTIYAWRGAGAKNIESLGLPVLPLTNCWRCSGAIIQEARKFVPDIRTTNPQGDPVAKSSWMPHWPSHKPSTIIARTNATLIGIALELKKSPGTRVFILGKDFAKTLGELLAKLKGQARTQLLESLEKWQSKTLAKYPHKAGEIKDQAKCLKTILEGTFGRKDAEKALGELFLDEPQPGAWTLTTVHKAKGLEWPEVFVLDWHKPRVAGPESSWILDEDRNLRYVARTRAQARLTIIQADAIQQATGQSQERGELLSPEGELLSGGERGQGLWD